MPSSTCVSGTFARSRRWRSQASRTSFRPPWTLALQVKRHCSPRTCCSPDKLSSAIRWSNLTKVSWSYKSSCANTSLTMGVLHSPLTFGHTTPHRRRIVLTPCTGLTTIGSCTPTLCLVMSLAKARATTCHQFIATLLTASTHSYLGRRRRWRFRWQINRWWSSWMRRQTITKWKECRRNSSWTCAIVITCRHVSTLCYGNRPAWWAVLSSRRPTSSTKNPNWSLTRSMMRRCWSRTWRKHS